MRSLIGVGVILWVLLGVDLVQGREWVSRDGRFTVEAELLTVDGDQVVLRRAAGAVIRVPLDRLSLGDVKYVQEALQAAGVTPPAAHTTPAPETAPPANPQPQPAPAPQGPPLAQPGRVEWQAAPDPAPKGFDLKPGATVKIPIPVRYSRPFVLFPASPSPFVLLGGEASDGDRQLWDLREQKAIGTIEEDVAKLDADEISGVGSIPESTDAPCWARRTVAAMPSTGSPYATDRRFRWQRPADLLGADHPSDCADTWATTAPTVATSSPASAQTDRTNCIAYPPP